MPTLTTSFLKYFYLGFPGGSDGKESAFLFIWLFWVLIAPHVI